MVKLSQAIGSALLLGAVPALAEHYTVEMPVKSAVLYINSAEILRDVRLDVTEAGVHTVDIVAPLSSEPGDVDVQLEGAQLLAQQVISPLSEHEPTVLKKELAQIETNMQMVNDQIGARQHMVAALAKSLKKMPENSAGIAAQLANLNQELATLRQEFKALELNYEQFSQKLNDEQSRPQENNRIRRLQIQVPEAGIVDIRTQEYSQQASWQPASRFNLNTESSKLAITAYANISQQTGLDWQDVNLTLAVTPPQDLQRPAFYSRSLSIYDPNQDAAAAKMSIVSGDMAYEAEEMVMGAPRARTQPVIINSDGDFSVELPVTYSLASIDSAQQVSYWQTTIPVTSYSAIYNWYANDKAVLVADWNQPQEISLLPGDMQIQRNGLTVANRQDRQLWTPDSEQSLSFGVDPRLQVKVSTPPDYNDESGFIDKSTVRQVREIYDVSTPRQKPVDLRFYAQLPVSGEADIEVKEKFKPGPDQRDVDGVKGILLWEVKVDKDAPWHFEFGYDISYPKDKVLRY